jgi:hypothetical protein
MQERACEKMSSMKHAKNLRRMSRRYLRRINKKAAAAEFPLRQPNFHLQNQPISAPVKIVGPYGIS